MFAILVCVLIYISQYEATDHAACKNWLDTHMSQTKDFEYYSNLIVRIKFDTSAELKINCTNATKPTTGKLYLLSMYPKRSGRTIFSYDLNIKQFVSLFNFSEVRRVSFHNLHGFNPTRPYIYNQVDQLFVFNSKFDFYLNETTKITRELCVPQYFHQPSVFSGIISLSVSNTDFSTSVCPYILANTAINAIAFMDIANSFIYKNELKFMDLNESVLSIRDLAVLNVEAAYIHLSNSLLNQQLFKNAKNIIICCYIYSIHEHLLENFIQLKTIMLKLDTFDLNLKIGFKWLHSLNKEINVRDSSVVTWTERNHVVFVYFTDIQFAFKKFYTYPDRDLCFFRDFPLHRLVYPILTSRSPTPITCTCTVIWLIQYSKYVMAPNFTKFNEDVITAYLAIEHCFQRGEPYISSRIRECNFEERLSKCFEKKRNLQINGWSLRPLLFDYKWMQYVIEVYLQSCMCVLSLVTNLLTICVIRSKKAAHLKPCLHNIMYEHIVANSVFNILYSLIKLLSLVNICIFPHTSFCSTIYQTETSQYFKIYVIYFLGNAIRLCANISYIAFSVGRYFLSTSNPSRTYKLFESLNLRRFYSFLCLCAMFISSFKIFQFKVNDFFPNYDANYPFDAYGINYCHYNLIEQTAKWNSIVGFKCNLFDGLTMVNTILNNMVFFFISIIIDLSLIRFTNQNLERKRKLITREDSPGLVQALKFKENMNRMIITNGLLYFVSHVPEFFVTLLLLVYKNSLSIYCTTFFSCIEFVEIAQVFNFCSIGLQFFVFKHFDKNFRKCLEHMIGRISPAPPLMQKKREELH